jgi:hypothetical protein
LTVHIIDDSNGVTVYVISIPVSVLPSSNQILSDLTQSILCNFAYSEQLLQINSGNLNLIALNLISLVRTFNMENFNNLSSQLNTQNKNKQSEFLEFFLDKLNEISISDTSSMKIMGSCLSELTRQSDFVSSKIAVIFIQT